MNIPETHRVSLRFKLDFDMPKDIWDKWHKLKFMCENGENEDIVYGWLSKCRKKHIRNMPYLKRCEGGIGGNDNFKNKQIRFREEQQISCLKDNDIVLSEINNTEQEKWSFDELDDLVYGFKEYANDFLGTNDCIRGVIEITNSYQ